MERFHLEPRTGFSTIVSKGQILRITDPVGEQVADLVVFARHDSEEYSSSGRSIDYNEKVFFSEGDVIYSNLSNPMLTIVADKVGKHDFLFAPCSQEMFEKIYGVEEPHPNCLNNLAQVLSDYGIRKSQIPIAFNTFMNTTITPQGEIRIEPASSGPGDHIDFRAEMDLIVGVTACSALKCNNYKCTSIEVTILE